MNRIALAVAGVLLLGRTLYAQDPGDLQDPDSPGDSAALVKEDTRVREVALPSALPPSLVFRTEAGGTSAGMPASADTLPPVMKSRLLPDNISWMEKALWSETGLMRGMGIASPLTPEVRKHELEVRRTMLTAHQIGGLLTLGLMLTTDYFGQKYLDHGDRKMFDWHRTFLTATIITYSATGALSILSPPPVIRRDEVSTTTIHKTLAWIHFAGMVVTPILGAAISRRGASYYDRARFHQIAAYTTTAVFAASMIIITF